MSMKANLVVAVVLLGGPFAHAEERVQIEVGKDYDRYSNEELRRRVWTLERAVSQLQDQVFQLALKGGGSSGSSGGGDWTCRIESFGKTLVSGGSTRSAALAKVLKKCSDATNAVHCHESDVKCDNE